jgi:hypothetical protein
LVSAINLKAEYEKLLGIPYSAPYDKIWPAGTENNQAAVRGLKERDDPEVWLDTVSKELAPAEICGRGLRLCISGTIEIVLPCHEQACIKVS